MTAVLSDDADSDVDIDYALLYTYTLCDSEPGYGPRVVTLECATGVTGRYLYLYLNNSDTISLTLCEVEVYKASKY